MVILRVMPRIRRVLVDITGMLTIPKGRGEIPHGHGRDIFCNKKRKQFQRRALLMDCARKRIRKIFKKEREQEKERERNLSSLFIFLVKILGLEKIRKKKIKKLSIVSVILIIPERFGTFSSESD